RPSEAPRRRASGPVERQEEVPGAAGRPAITFAPGPPPGAPARPAPERAVVTATEPFAAAPKPAPALAPTLPQGAVLGIEEAQNVPSRSRGLVGVGALVVGAGVLFLILGMLFGRAPAPASQATATVPDGGVAGATPGSEIAAPQPHEPDGPGADLDRLSQETAPTIIASVGDPPPAAIARPRTLRSPIHAPGFDPPDPGDEPAPEAQAPASGAMELKIEADERTWAQIFCDSREVVNRVLSSGERVTARCVGEIRVSAADAAALRLTINGAGCPPLGDPGARVLGYTIRSDDFRQICPPAGGGRDARF
ncbi:MAG TPA: RodZ domain-containing protein, partial [Candidatus Polarisedimenticolia bacterium]|nr:RodZ domain-containing protein [Candidatus Polarisedimenticolia bacterium]